MGSRDPWQSRPGQRGHEVTPAWQRENEDPLGRKARRRSTKRSHDALGRRNLFADSVCHSSWVRASKSLRREGALSSANPCRVIGYVEPGGCKAIGEEQAEAELDRSGTGQSIAKSS